MLSIITFYVSFVIFIIALLCRYYVYIVVVAVCTYVVFQINILFYVSLYSHLLRPCFYKTKNTCIVLRFSRSRSCSSTSSRPSRRRSSSPTCPPRPWLRNNRNATSSANKNTRLTLSLPPPHRRVVDRPRKTLTFS